MVGHQERDRQEDFRELLEGLRTTLPAIQVLFGFLLIVPFQATFQDLGDTATALYMTSFASAAVASALLIAPSVHQRIHWMSGERVHDEHHLQRSIRIALGGTVAMAVALASGLALVTLVVLDGLSAVLLTAAFVVVIAMAWFGLKEVVRR